MPSPMHATSPDAVLADVGNRTLDLLARAQHLTEADLAAPSALPGWTRGHVLAHVVGNADAFTKVLLRAVTAEDAGLMYPSAQDRDAAVEAGAAHPPAEQVRRLLTSAHRLAVAWRDLEPDRLHVTVSGTAGWTRPVRDVPWMRWRELALHAVDVGWPAEFAPGDALVARLLDEVADAWAQRPDAPAVTVVDTDREATWSLGTADGTGDPAAGGVRVGGPIGELVLWLTGRSDGSALSASGPLPTLPPWL